MVRTLLIIITILFINSCDKKEENNVNPTDTPSPPGSVEFRVSWDTSEGYCDPAYSVWVGLGYSSYDVVNDVFFETSAEKIISPATYNFDDLEPGTYYYKAWKSYSQSTCGGSSIPDVDKSGSFTITSDEETKINVGTL